MGKIFTYISEQDESLKKIRFELNKANIKYQETQIQYGIKFICDEGSIFILYFSKGKSSKIYFKKETQKVITIIDSLCNNVNQPFKEKSIQIYASYNIPKDKQELIKHDILNLFTVTEKNDKKRYHLIYLRID